MNEKTNSGRCKFCGEPATGRYDFRFWLCDSDECNRELEQYELEREEQAREAAERDAFGRYY